MALQIKTIFLIVLLLFIPLSSGTVEGVADGMNRNYMLNKDGTKMNMRKLWEIHAVLDYEDAGANTKHDPKKGKGGGGGGGGGGKNR